MSFRLLEPFFCLPANISKLLEPSLPPLGPGQPRIRFGEQLLNVELEATFGTKRTESSAVMCCLAGMWLWNGFLERSHNFSQSIDTPEGSWWHGIMHRREPDAGNAAYWFRCVGEHSLFSALGDNVQKHAAQTELPDEAQWLLECTHWKPQQFIDACESARRDSNETVCHVLREVAAIEWYTLFNHCLDMAGGTNR
ncbi:MAG TPA: hypothetical protein DEB70_07055 [Planctomycetaceae bacterium]|nr:hypothetical protein [Planctomycetaceae bacterium]